MKKNAFSTEMLSELSMEVGKAGDVGRNREAASDLAGIVKAVSCAESS